MKYIIYMLTYISTLNNTFAGSVVKPIVPTDVLMEAELQDIAAKRNYFFYKDMDYKTPIWRSTGRKYGSHFLGNRTFGLNMSEVVHKTLVDGFNIQYQLEELYREKIGVHKEIGGVIPHINFQLGGSSVLAPDKIFSGLFGFLFPTHWMKIANQKRVYELTKHYLTLAILDEILNAKVAYINQHQLIQEFEIINFYFIHMQILADYDAVEFDNNHLIRAIYTAKGTEMASKRGEVKLGFDSLAALMGMERDANDRSAGRLNIEDIKDFPSEVEQLSACEEVLRSKEKFVEAVMERSIEMKVVKELYKVSQLNIGITGFGGSLADVSNHTTAQLTVNLGYGTIPGILESISNKRTARIDVRSEYIKMLNLARTTHDLYTNALGGFTEASRALKKNREIFKQNVANLLAGTDKTGGIPVIIGVNILIQAELKYNNALHGSLIAKANIERYLLTNSEGYLKYLPQKDVILKAFKKSKVAYDESLEKEDKFKKLFSTLYTTKKLRRLLYENHPEDATLFSKGKKPIELKGAIQENIDLLLKGNIGFFMFKKQKFYVTLEKYLKKNHIYLTCNQRAKLNKKLGRPSESVGID